jgi:DNA-binding FadR family transcriptional regulator
MPAPPPTADTPSRAPGQAAQPTEEAEAVGAARSAEEADADGPALQTGDEAASVPERIAASLRADILTGHYRTGERLPSERELAERFSTHRGAVREALKMLDQLGLAEIRRGGARAAPIEEASLDIVKHMLALESPPDPELFDQVFEVFSGLFSLSARLGAERADDTQRARVAQILERLTADDLPMADEHGLINALSEIFVEASGNPILALARRGVRTGVIEHIENRETLLRPSDTDRAPLLRRVAEAFAAGDGPGASNAIYDLTRAVRRNAVATLEQERARLGIRRRGSNAVQRNPR